MINTQVIDDFLPKKVVDELHGMLFSDEFPWYFVFDVTYGSYDDKREKNIPGFGHQFFNPRFGASTFYPNVSTLPFIGRKKLPPSRVIAAKTFFQLATNTPQNNQYNNKHVDVDTPHIVLLYYVCDSDGDTFLFEKNKSSDVVTRRVTPKKNRALVFDGSIYHASSRPEHTNRCIINFNLIPFEEIK